MRCYSNRTPCAASLDLVILFHIRLLRHLPGEGTVSPQHCFAMQAVVESLTFSAKTGFPDKWLKCTNSKCKVPNSAKILLPPEAQGQFLPIPLKKRRDERVMGQNNFFLSFKWCRWKTQLLNNGSSANSPLWIF